MEGSRKKNFFILMFCLVLIWPAMVSAEGENDDMLILDEVVVSETRTDVKLLDTPGTINIITAAEIEKGGYVDVADVINGLPGITNDTTNPATPKFNFRGTAYAHSRGATVYVDGKEINIGRIGYGDLSFVDLNDVEQIQVIKTPGSEFSESARGVIYITTKKGKKQGHFQKVKASYGSWGLHKENVTAYGKEDKIDYRLSLNNQGGEGYRRTEDERVRGQLKGGYSFDENSRFSIGGGFQDQSYLSNTSLDKWQWELDPRDNTPWNSETNPTFQYAPYGYDVKIYDVFADLNTDRNDWFMKSMISFVHNDTEYLSEKNKNNPRYADGKDTSSYLRDYDEDRLTMKASGGKRFTGKNYMDTLTVGAEYDNHDYDQVRTYPYLDVIDSTRERYMQQYDLEIGIDRISVFVDNNLTLFENFNLKTGLRYDTVDLSFKNEYEADPDVDNEYNETSWNISPSYSFTGNDNLYFTASQTYFYPNIDYTRMSAQRDDEYPENNPENLKPEDILTFELGYKQKVNRFFNYSIAVYHMNVRDKFIFQYRYNEEDDEWESIGACNLGDTIHRGIELEIDGRPADWFSYKVNYGYLKAEWNDPEVYYSSYIWEEDPSDDYREGSSIDGKTLYRTPEHKVSATLAFYPVEDLTAWFNIIYVGDQYVDYLERVVQPSVTTVDFKLAYTFRNVNLGPIDMDGVTLHGLIKNLTDEDYAYYSNTTGARNSDGSLDTSYYVFPGRYFEIGLTMDF